MVDDPTLHCLVEIPKGSRNKYQWDTEIEHFFSIYKQPEGRQVTVHGWEDAAVAGRVLQEGRERFRASRG